jgi:hypothetical protein
MAVPITVKNKKSPLNGKTYYLCVQIDSLPEGEVVSADFSEGKPRRGRQVYIEYKVDDTERKGLVWLKGVDD